MAIARSGLPSPLKSPIETEAGFDPVANVVWAAYDGVVAPGTVVLRSTLTELELRLAIARSGLPSPLKSPIETEMGFEPVANVVWAAYVGVVAPSAVVLRSTLTELEFKLATARSGLPSPFKSPIATEAALSPVANVACGESAIAGVPSSVVLRSTLAEPATLLPSP